MLNAITLIIFSNEKFRNLCKLNLGYISDEKLTRAFEHNEVNQVQLHKIY